MTGRGDLLEPGDPQFRERPAPDDTDMVGELQFEGRTHHISGE
jgi:hypothetical protein